VTTPPREKGSSPHNLFDRNCVVSYTTDVTPVDGEQCAVCSSPRPAETSVEKAAAYGQARELGS
jgi:hypothetical protein